MVEGCEQVELPEGMWQQSEPFKAQVQALKEGSERQQGIQECGWWRDLCSSRKDILSLGDSLHMPCEPSAEAVNVMLPNTF